MRFLCEKEIMSVSGASSLVGMLSSVPLLDNIAGGVYGFVCALIMGAYTGSSVGGYVSGGIFGAIGGGVGVIVSVIGCVIQMTTTGALEGLSGVYKPYTQRFNDMLDMILTYNGDNANAIVKL